MHWYLAKIIYQIICGEGEHTPQFDEQLRLIHAVDAEAAYQKAKQIGEMEQTNFLNQHQQLVQWQFINIADLIAMKSDMDGAEVFSRIVEIHDPSNYIVDIHNRSGRILAQEHFNFIQTA
jgi:hypothetical protein